MTNASVISVSRIITTILWGAVVGLIIAAWATLLTGRDELTPVLGYTACALSAVAAVAHIRGYFTRVLNVIRALNGSETGGEREVHPLR